MDELIYSLSFIIIGVRELTSFGSFSFLSTLLM